MFIEIMNKLWLGIDLFLLIVEKRRITAVNGNDDS